MASPSGGSAINSNDLLHTETYPDTYVVTHEYNRQGQQTLLTDQNGTVHTYLYDKLGRSTDDQVTTVTSPVDSPSDGSPPPTKSAVWSQR